MLATTRLPVPSSWSFVSLTSRCASVVVEPVRLDAQLRLDVGPLFADDGQLAGP